MTKGKTRPEKPEAADDPPQFSQDIASEIAAIIDQAGEKGLTKDEICSRLAEKFPERDHEALHVSVNAIVPHRVSHGQFMVERTREGRYRKLLL